MWIVRAWSWIKENLFIAGAAVGGLLALVLSIVYNDDSDEAILKSRKESNDARRDKDEKVLKITEEFIENIDSVKDKARQAGKELDVEQEEVLKERIEAFSSADTPAEKAEIANEIQEVFPFAEYVDPSAFGEVE